MIPAIALRAPQEFSAVVHWTHEGRVGIDVVLRALADHRANFAGNGIGFTYFYALVSALGVIEIKMLAVFEPGEARAADEENVERIGIDIHALSRFEIEGDDFSAGDGFSRKWICRREDTRPELIGRRELNGCESPGVARIDAIGDQPPRIRRPRYAYRSS